MNDIQIIEYILTQARLGDVVPGYSQNMFPVRRHFSVFFLAVPQENKEDLS